MQRASPSSLCRKKGGFAPQQMGGGEAPTTDSGIDMQRGTVKWFSDEKGYGFIKPQDGSEDVFVHRNNVSGLEWEESLREGETVEYETERTPKGISAINVQRTETGSNVM